MITKKSFFATAAALGLAVAALGGAQAAVILDWTDWDPTFDDGSDGKQKFTNSDGIEIEFDPKESNANGQPKPEFIFGTPAINSAGGAGEALDLQQSAEPGDGSRNRLNIKGGNSLQGASLTVGGIDGATLSGDNYIDEIRFSATLGDGSTVAPTRIFVSNSLLVSQIGADTVSAIPNAGSSGSVQIFFDVPDISRIEINFMNSESGTVANTADDQAIWIGDLVETGIVVVPVPEPGVAVLVLSGLLIGLRRRRK